MNTKFTLLLVAITVFLSSCAKETFLFSNNTGNYGAFHKAGTTISANEPAAASEEPVFTASTTVEPQLKANPADLKQVSTASRINALYNSDNKDLKTFRKEYKNIKKDFRKQHFSVSDSKKEANKIQNVKEGGGGFSIASLAVGVVGLLVAALLCGILAIIFAAIGLARGKYKGLAIAGLILGIIEVIIGIAVLAA